MYKKVYAGLTEDQMVEKHQQCMQKSHDLLIKLYPSLKFGCAIINLDGTFTVIKISGSNVGFAT